MLRLRAWVSPGSVLWVSSSLALGSANPVSWRVLGLSSVRSLRVGPENRVWHPEEDRSEGEAGTGLEFELRFPTCWSMLLQVSGCHSLRPQLHPEAPRPAEGHLPQPHPDNCISSIRESESRYSSSPVGVYPEVQYTPPRA